MSGGSALPSLPRLPSLHAMFGGAPMFQCLARTFLRFRLLAFVAGAFVTGGRLLLLRLSRP